MLSGSRILVWKRLCDLLQAFNFKWLHKYPKKTYRTLKRQKLIAKDQVIEEGYRNLWTLMKLREAMT